MRDVLSSAGADGPGSVLNVLRLLPGQTCSVRTLSPTYLGMLTHYHAGRGVVCEGSDCHPTLHRTAIFWKGYAAVEVWVEKKTLWVPFVLELTDNSELDVRGVWKRGQVWELSKPRKVTKKEPTMLAVLVADRCEGELPDPFDFEPTLRRLYRAELLYLGQANPLPPRQVIRASSGAAPPTRLSMEREREKRTESSSHQSLLDVLKKRRAGLTDTPPAG